MSAIGWFFAAVGVAFVAGVSLWAWRGWVQPWREMEELVQEVIHGRAPRTFLISGNRSTERIGVALEDVFLRQRDLTQRALEDELNTQAILGAMRDGLAVLDASGRVRILNQALRQLFALAEEGAGRNVIETFRDPLVADLVTRTLRTGEAGNASINVRGSWTNEDRRVAVTSLPIQGERDERSGAVVLFHDVTQLQQLEQIRREFVSNVSHELRTPLSIFRGYLETLLDEPDLTPNERERILRVLQKHSSRLQSLVEDLLTLARLETPNLRLQIAPLSLAEFLPHCVKEWDKIAMAKQLKIVAQIETDLPAIPADEARLGGVIYNLLDNAVKYSTSGGTICVAAARHGMDEIELTVRDEGTGIAAADLPRIFERFYRADKARSRDVGGTGLGLAIVKHIAQLHGGSVEAESEIGRGTTVRMILPLAEGASAAAS